MLVNEQFHYEERLDDKIYAKQMFYGPLELVNNKRASVYLGRQRDGKSVEELAKRYNYTEGSVEATISNTIKKFESLFKASDKCQLIQHLHNL
jgi:Mor family transcriptional regulator